jgi:hypothetical protein
MRLTPRMRVLQAAALVWGPLVGLVMGPSRAVVSAADLRDQTAAAFERYIRLTEARMEAELRGAAPFLHVNRLADPERRDSAERLRRGAVVVSRLETRDGGRPIEVPDGLCHHWVGTVFAPGTRLADVAALMQGYDRYPEVYRPAIRRSRVLSRDGDRFRVFLRLFKKKILSVVLDSEYAVEYVSVPPNRMLVRSYATRIAEVERPDTPEEREKPVGRDSGFLWRFNNYCKLEEADGGTYIQCESISLSRDVPVGLGWLIGRFVTSIPREELEFTLGAMRAALRGAP